MDGCTYEHADGPLCGAVARWHIVALDDYGELCAYDACERHRAEMSANAAWVHPWTPRCTTGLFRPDQNRCLADSEECPPVHALHEEVDRDPAPQAQPHEPHLWR